MKVEGYRLYIRPLDTPDAASLADAVNVSLSELIPTMPWVNGTVTLKDEKQFIDAAGQKMIATESLTCGMFLSKTDELIGTIGTHAIDWMNQRTSIGYWIATPYAGNGYTPEASVLMLEYLFTEYKLHRVGIQTALANARSKRVIEKLGFTFEGEWREAELVHGSWKTLASFSMLAQEYRGRKEELYRALLGGHRPKIKFE